VADALGDDVMNIADSFFVNAVRQLHNRAVEQFRCMHLSLVFAPPGYSFVYGDSPVIFTNNTAQGYKVGLREGAKWGREHTKQLVWPISRNTMSVLSWEPAAPRILTPRECVQLNQLQLRTTGRHLGCHPDDDPSALLGVQVTIRQRNRGSARDRSP
jgi:hypothetical protein